MHFSELGMTAVNSDTIIKNKRSQHIDEDHLADKTGDNGIMYNIHYPLDPEHIGKTAHDYAGVLQKKIDVGEY
jgi:hypothetical protein